MPRPRSRPRPCTVPAGATAVVLAAVVLALLALPASAAGDPAPGDWRDVLARATDTARSTVYAGETLWITWVDGQPHVSIGQVSNATDSGLVLADPQRFTVRFDRNGGGVVHHGDGWLTALPAAMPKDAAHAMDALAAKYDVAVDGTSRIMDRRCTELVIHRRSDGRLRERLWVDEASGLVLRRESYDGADLVRLGTYVSLDLRPARPPVGAARVPLAATRGRVVEVEQQVAAVDDQGLAALDDAGWIAPATLPGGYRSAGAYALAAVDGQPLQIVYDDGLYAVSLFQQPGRTDWSALPDGAVRIDGIDGAVFEWPGAMPRRLVWEADGVTYSLVGDAPPDELLSIVRALPAAERGVSGFVGRLRRGLGRLWTWMSPWD